MFRSIRAGSPRSPFLVVGVGKGASRLPRGVPGSAAAKRALADALETPGFSGKSGSFAMAGGTGMLVGLGEIDELTTADLRTIGGKIVRKLDAIEVSAARIVVAGAVPKRVMTDAAVGECLGEGMGLANWRVDFFDGTATKRREARSPLTVSIDEGARAGFRRGLTTADCVNEARRMAATPPNICNPEWVASEARRLARKAGLTCRVITYAEAQKLGMGGLVNVGKGSTKKPRMVILEHRPARAKKGTCVVLVGKTMTYDTGGYSLKISNSMKGMKYDGNGGCAVLGAMLDIAARKLPVRVVGLLPTAENMVSGEAYRPDDIITMYNGVSVEVTNTDAEGRLILGDALAYACKKYKPTAIVDAATLTGGVVVALGSWCAGLFCGDDKLRNRVEDAAAKTDERVWPLPLWEEHRDFMRAKHADVWNSGPKREGHPIQGAAFLSFFVDEEIPWAHIDIAGVSDVTSSSALHVVGPTGFGVRLMTEIAAGFS